MSSTSLAFSGSTFGKLVKRHKVGNGGKSPPQNVKFRSVKAELSTEKVRIAILGASGYTGAELTRLLVNHPFADIALMTADRKAGQSFGSVFPHLDAQDLPNLVAIADADFSNVDAVFCCLPHGTTQDIIKGLPEHLKIIDLSADFRLQDTAVYKEAYGQDHRAPELQKTAEYGLTEIKREAIRKARLVANPGCYPTSIQLPLIPLFKAGLLELKNIIIDAKSGVSGAGRSPKEPLLYAELREGIYSYGITNHRHVYEIEQGLSEVLNSNVTVSFTPHLMPMDEYFVKLLKKGDVPHTNHVSGSNYCKMNVFPDRIPGRAIIVSVIDNLVKGASGQALQNFNVMFGFPETTGLLYQPLFP
uniref:Semialdehyde dehydrogenase NAD-binding domain-containing protein n=1 Tax=Kalanchoe fedtschenkoi TaxID=63787 RepID=A0A7N0TEG8_KALFE